MGIRAFSFDRELMRDFVRFPYVAYREDPRWVPPLEATMLAELDADSEFFQDPGNAHRHFIARRGSRTIGRITASINAGLRDEAGAPIGCLGFFESDGDPAAAEELIGTAAAWLRDRHRVGRIWGPIDLDLWHGYRFMTRGFDTRGFLGEPYQKPYYPELFERCGFAVCRRWHSFESADLGREACFWRRAEDRQSALLEAGYRFVAFDEARIPHELRKLHALMMRSYAHFPGFTPISAEEFVRRSLPLRYALLPGAAGFVHDPRDEPCGFATVLRDLSDALRAMRGRTTLMTRARFMRVRSRTRSAFLHLVGLTPEEARRHSGLGAAMIAHVLDGARHCGQRPALAALVAADSPARGHLARAGAVATREYALYELQP